MTPVDFAAYLQIVIVSGILLVHLWLLYLDRDREKDAFDRWAWVAYIVGSIGFSFVLAYYIGTVTGAFTPADAPRLIRWPVIAIYMGYLLMIFLFRYQRGIALQLYEMVKALERMVDGMGEEIARLIAENEALKEELANLDDQVEANKAPGD